MYPLYKLISKIIVFQLRTLVEISDVLSVNQMGTRRFCQGAKQAVLINKTLNVVNDSALHSTWIDIAKAYDNVHHTYLMDILTKLGVPQNIVEFVQRALWTLAKPELR